MTEHPYPQPSARLAAVLDQLPDDQVDEAARTLYEHLEHGGTRVQAAHDSGRCRQLQSWCACGALLGPALLVKAGERRLHALLDEVVARRA